MRTFIGLLALAAGCQDYGISSDYKDPPRPVDTDEGVALDYPQVALEPASLDFGFLPVDCAAVPATITIRNVGTATLEVDAVELRGDDAAAYQVDVELEPLRPGREITVEVRFTPSELRAFDNAELVVISNDPDDFESIAPLTGEGADNALYEELHIQPEPNAVDVLWVIDNSGSMRTELQALAGSFQTFISSFVNLRLDYQIGIITTDMDRSGHQGQLVGPVITDNTPNPTVAFSDQTTLGADGSGTERGMDATMAALSSPLIEGANVGFLRPDANLAVVVVSDEDDDSDVEPDAFVTWLQELKPDANMVSFSGMVGPDGGSRVIATPACTSTTGPNADHAPIYHDAIESSEGVWGDLCDLQINPFLTFLSYAAAGLRFDFELSYTPSSIGSIAVTIDNVELSYGQPHGWTYDPLTNRVTLHGDAIPGPGAGIRVTYPFATTCE